MRYLPLAATLAVICVIGISAALLPSQAADDPSAGIVALDITGLPKALYCLDTRTDPPTVTPLTLVPIGPAPGPVPEPDPTPDADLTKSIVAAVEKIPADDSRHAVALQLAKVYEMLAGQTIPADKTIVAVNTIVKMMILDDVTEWSGVLDVVNEALGKCKTEAEADAVLVAASSAISSTVPAGDLSTDDAYKEAAGKYGLDWEKFLEKLIQLLTVLLPLIIGA